MVFLSRYYAIVRKVNSTNVLYAWMCVGHLSRANLECTCFVRDCLAKSLQNEIPSVQFVRNLSLFPCLAPLRQHEYQLLTLFAYTKRVSGKELVVDSITILTLSVNADPSSVQEKEAVGQLFPCHHKPNWTK